MAANVETMAYAGEVPWHGLGNDIGVPTENEHDMLVAAGLNWHVDRCDLWALIPQDTPEGSNASSTHLEALTPVDGWQALVRNTDKSVLHLFRESYVPVQNVDMFRFARAVADIERLEWHTAGALNGGRTVWALGKLVDPIMAGPDQLDRYMLFANSFDGTRSLSVRFTTVRVVCQNTLNAASREAAAFSIRHTGDPMTRAAAANKALGLASSAFADLQTEVDALVAKKMTAASLDKWLADLIPDVAVRDDAGVVTHSTVPTAREHLRDLFDTGIGNEHALVRGTGWAALNAVTQYVTHERPTRITERRKGSADPAREARLESSWFGEGARLVDHAKKLLLVDA